MQTTMTDFHEYCEPIIKLTRQEKKILELYLQAWNTEEKIAEMLNIPIEAVNNAVARFKTDVTDEKLCHKYGWHLPYTHPGHSKSKPFRYNIWRV